MFKVNFQLFLLMSWSASQKLGTACFGKWKIRVLQRDKKQVDEASLVSILLIVPRIL